VLEFLVAGASAVQIGTANYYDPTISQRLVEQLPLALAEAGVRRVSDLVKTLQLPAAAGQADVPAPRNERSSHG
jgi:dihydroorotate dehydrogenase (NAD+) catalytic subunit